MNAKDFMLARKIEITILIAVSAISFFSGMEYKSYQIRTVMEEAARSISSGFAGARERGVESKKDPVVVPVAKGQSYTLSGSNGAGSVKLGVMEIVDLGKTWKSNPYMEGETANGRFYGVIVASENVGKEPAFLSLSDMSLITKDGVRYAPKESVQGMKKYDGYSTCVSCKNNPGEKAAEGLLFDLPNPLDGGKIEMKISDDTTVNFDL